MATNVFYGGHAATRFAVYSFSLALFAMHLFIHSVAWKSTKTHAKKYVTKSHLVLLKVTNILSVTC
jgi:hypothetical protein